MMSCPVVICWISEILRLLRRDQEFCAMTGHPARLSYGIDSSGNTCGQKNTWNGGSGPDLTEYKNLYYLNPLELLDTNTFLGARSVCVKQCPGAESACGLSSLPCRSDVQYRCILCTAR